MKTLKFPRVSRKSIKQSTRLIKDEEQETSVRLIKHFLKDRRNTGKQKSERGLAEANVHAEVLLVKHCSLELADRLAMDCFSKENREALK